ncbi:hypothetical protein LX32DRAFT_365518 [Colletotrichum zoysiae]|uniref:Uncharacterized protein n=1 Tax=Colletotrichum zoysiae TaxID=1216348 RepID=A0AAD9HI08_9PEZI|nr:hypothetical protein LX32DRAFT_365518 [Colletotrichum zoysiae]
MPASPMGKVSTFVIFSISTQSNLAEHPDMLANCLGSRYTTTASHTGDLTNNSRLVSAEIYGLWYRTETRLRLCRASLLALGSFLEPSDVLGQSDARAPVQQSNSFTRLIKDKNCMYLAAFGTSKGLACLTWYALQTQYRISVVSAGPTACTTDEHSRKGTMPCPFFVLFLAILGRSKQAKRGHGLNKSRKHEWAMRIATAGERGDAGKVEPRGAQIAFSSECRRLTWSSCTGNEVETVRQLQPYS